MLPRRSALPEAAVAARVNALEITGRTEGHMVKRLWGAVFFVTLRVHRCASVCVDSATEICCCGSA